MPEADLHIGLDVGTSGARAIAIDASGAVRAEAKADMAAFGANRRSPRTWWDTARTAIAGVLADVAPHRVRSIAVDGTSGTMLPIRADGTPLTDGLMYNDACEDAGILARIDDTAPADSAARGISSGLARALTLSRCRPDLIIHQADWIAGRLSGRWVSDENNALKTGYDLGISAWPDWIAETGLDMGLLPDVVPPGTLVGQIAAAAASEFGLRQDTCVVAGTTDGCASFIATGADGPGDGVTALGTTLTIKMLSDKPISAPAFGIYSHRIAGNWLAGGASNSGGNVLLKFFDADRLAALSALIDTDQDYDLGYYPLAAPGERFPIADPTLAPRTEPRPTDDVAFLGGLLDGIAGIEALGYRRLQEQGAPRLVSIRTVGGGAKNAAWTGLRQRRLDVPMRPPTSIEAAYGTALLARQGVA